MVVPDDLRPVIGRRELRYSLHERSLLHAKRKAHRISTQVKGLFAKLRKGNGNMDQAQINRLIRNMIKTSIAEMEHEKAAGKTLTRGQLNDYLNDLDLFEHDYREALSLRDFRLIYPVVDSMIEEGNLSVKKGSEGYLRLAAEVLKAQIHLLQVDRQQSTGDYSYQCNRQFNCIFTGFPSRGMMSPKDKEARSWSSYREPNSWSKSAAIGSSRLSSGNRPV
jgi:hypothetical protein